MATSGAMSTSNQFIKYTITVTQNSQNITNNTSNVTVSVRFYRTNTGYTSYGTGTVYCKIDGTTYSASVTPSQKITENGIVLFTKTMNISHSTDGTKTLACSAWISHNVVTSSEQSYSQTLTTIPRKSSLSVANGTLGTAQTLTVTRHSTSFTHTIIATCGSTSTTICTKSSSTSISFTPPLSWASQNTTGTSFSVKYTITTYNGNTSIGSNSYTKACSIPASVKPSCSLTVTDSTGYADTYGGFIKGLSKFKIVVTPTTSYDSAIASYSTKANGSTYTAATFTTGVLKSSGSQTITATVKDKRGRSGSASVTKTVLDYTKPNISKLTVKRCNEDGTENIQGEYVCVTFSAKVTALSNKNTAEYTLSYKKSTDSRYTEVGLDALDNVYTVTDSTYIIPAESGSSYAVEVSAKDAFTSANAGTRASTAFALFHFTSGGTGLAIGKIAEHSNLLDIGMKTKFNDDVYGTVAGLGYVEPIPANSDFNNYVIPGIYGVPQNAVAATIANMPVQSAGRLEVVSSLGQSVYDIQNEDYAYLIQRFWAYNGGMYERYIHTTGTPGAWTCGSWHKYIRSDGGEITGTLILSKTQDLSGTADERPALIIGGQPTSAHLEIDNNEIQAKEDGTTTAGLHINPNGGDLAICGRTYGKNTVLWSGGKYMTADHTISLANSVANQPHGIVLVFSFYDGSEAKNQYFFSFFVPKYAVATHTGNGHFFGGNLWTYAMSKYLYIGNTSITGHANNGTDYGSPNDVRNSSFVLRYVLGV